MSKTDNPSARRNWTREELIVALSLYFQLPFGRLNQNTPEVKDLAKIIGRTKGSVAIRLTNFAACDPYILESGRTGMPAGVTVCKPIWEEFYNDKERLFYEAQRIKAEMQKHSIEQSLQISETSLKGTTKEALVKQRINQDVFRNMILNNYNQTCAITGINDSRLLIASHIIPWAEREDTRLNPENGICLSALYDKAFDKGLITIRPDDYTIMVSPSLSDTLSKSAYTEHFAKIENKKIMLPEEHKPKTEFLQYHVEKIFER